jgi:hypothetical protein
LIGIRHQVKTSSVRLVALQTSSLFRFDLFLVVNSQVRAHEVECLRRCTAAITDD